MDISIKGLLSRGYIPLACNRYASVAWEGEYLPDFWMWNRQYNEYDGNIRHIQTVMVPTLKEAALRYWRDDWVPISLADDGLLRRMEAALRAHPALKKDGIGFPEGPFLKPPGKLPAESLGPEVQRRLGIEGVQTNTLKSKDDTPQEVLDFYRMTRGER